MKKILSTLAALAVGVTLGFAVRDAIAGRNSSGTYSLPGGNPVVSGTTISSSWANTTLSDLSTEMTNSLDRNGRGGMLAPLKEADGTVAAPAFSFTSEPGTGFYRIGSSDLGLAVNGTKRDEWTASGEVVNGSLTCTAVAANASGVTCTGNGTGPGATFNGGAGGGFGVVSIGTGSQAGGSFSGGAGLGAGLVGLGGAGGSFGAYFTGTLTYPGIQSNGGNTGPGAVFHGGGTSGDGLDSYGGPFGYGISAIGGSGSMSGVYAVGGPPNGFAFEGHGGTGNGGGGLFYGGSSPAGGIAILAYGGAGGLGANEAAVFHAGAGSAAITLVPSSTPSFFGNGDIWIDTVSHVNAYLSGASRQLFDSGGAYRGVATISTGSVGAFTTYTTTITLSGAVAGADCILSPGSLLSAAGCVSYCYVTSNTCNIAIANVTSGALVCANSTQFACRVFNP